MRRIKSIFRGADIGEFAQGIIRNRQFRNLFLIDCPLVYHNSSHRNRIS